MSDIVLTIDDDAVDRRRDVRVFEIRLRLRERGGRLLHLRGTAFILCARVVDVRLRRESRFRETRLTIVLNLRIRRVDLRFGHVSLTLFDLRLKRSGIELREQLSFFYVAVEIGEESRDHAGNLTADLHGRDGRESAGRGDGHGDIAAINLLCLILLFLVSAALAGEKRCREKHCTHTSHDKKPLPITTFPCGR